MTRTGNNQHKPVTLEIARQDFIDSGYTPLFNEYKNNATKMTAETKEGYKVYTSLGKIRQGKEPYIFGKSNPYTVDNIRLWIKLSEFPHELISTEYQSACNHKLTWLCDKHGEFNADWNSIYSGNGGCYECRNEKISKTQTIYTIDSIKDKLLEINPNIEILSTKYEGYQSPLKCRCSVCGYEYESNWGRLSRGTQCLKCFIKYQRGENHPNWKGGISQLYDYLRSTVKEWRNDSFKKYHYMCDITKSNENLVVHHLYNFNEIMEETLEIIGLPVHQEINKYTDEELEKLSETCLQLHYKYGLGVCLTEKIHKEFHRVYGNKNTKGQYEEFKKKMKNKNKISC